MNIISVGVITPAGLNDWASAPSEGWRVVATALETLFDLVPNLNTRGKLRELMALGSDETARPRVVVVRAVEIMELYRLVCLSMSDVALNAADDAKECSYNRAGLQRYNPLDLTNMPSSPAMESHLQLLYMLNGLIHSNVDVQFRETRTPLLSVV